MSDGNQMLNQDEIDALLRSTGDEMEVEVYSDEKERINSLSGLASRKDEPFAELSVDEADALGEIGNITMGAAATTLSELLGQKVNITSPKVITCLQKELYASLKVPYIIIKVDYKSGVKGFCMLIMQTRDAGILADLMMGGNGNVAGGTISEMELSAASEAMNQMIGTASTSLSTVFGRTINISPPVTALLEVDGGIIDYQLPVEERIVVVSFRMIVGDLLDTEIMQIMSVQTAREEANLLLQQLNSMKENVVLQPEIQISERRTPAGETVAKTVSFPDFSLPPGKDRVKVEKETSILSDVEQRRLELLLDVPLKVSVILGRTRRPIKEVLNLIPGAIVELSSQVDEPVEILVNGTLVAHGEVVVVGENFGVRITNIISARERIQSLSG